MKFLSISVSSCNCCFSQVIHEITWRKFSGNHWNCWLIVSQFFCMQTGICVTGILSPFWRKGQWQMCEINSLILNQVVIKPIFTKEFSSRGQVDLIDMQSMAQSNYKWIMVYQDHHKVLYSKASQDQTCCWSGISIDGYFSYPGSAGHSPEW